MSLDPQYRQRGAKVSLTKTLLTLLIISGLRSVIGSYSLSVFKSRLRHYNFVGSLTSTHNRLPPAPLKLRPYGALQNMFIIVIFLLNLSAELLSKVLHFYQNVL